MLHAIVIEAPGCDEAMCIRYMHQQSLLGAMEFSRVLLLEILFPDDPVDVLVVVLSTRVKIYKRTKK
jgi:hypothetical protein